MSINLNTGMSNDELAEAIKETLRHINSCDMENYTDIFNELNGHLKSLLAVQLGRANLVSIDDKEVS